MTRERRRHPRKQVDLPAECELADGGQFGVRLAQMSVGGSFVQTERVQPFGTALRLHFSVPGSKQPLAVEAVVRWTSDRGMGVQFGAMGARETYELTEFLGKLPEAG